MKRILCASLAVMALLSGCAAGPQALPEDDGRLRVVATLFPHYDFARRIAGDKANVTMLLPPGVESHTFEPKPGDMADIHDADLFIYSAAGLEPWADKIAASLPQSVRVVQAASGIDLYEEAEHDHDEENGFDHDGNDHEYDPHVWLDLGNAASMCASIAEALSSADAANADYYARRAAEYEKELAQLDAEFAAMISNGRRDTLVFAGPFAYLYFLRHYGLEYVTAYDSCSSSSEPSVQRVAQVIDYVRENSTPCVYYEEFTNPKIAGTIAKETGAEPVLFSTAHNVTKEQLESEVTFLDIMRANFENVKRGLY